MTSAETETSAPPALFEHCQNTYHAMLQEAKTVVQVGHATSDASEGEAVGVELSDDLSRGSIVVYEGFFTHLVTQKLNLSVPYFTTVRKQLLRMGCIRQLKRGGGTSPSQWELIYEPTLEAFMTAAEAGKTAAGKANGSAEMVQQQIGDLNRRVTELTEQVTSIYDSLTEYFGSEPKENMS